MGSLLEKHCSRCGRVFKSHLFGCPKILSCDLELNTFILQNEGRLFQSSYPVPVLGNLGKRSIMFVSGDLHKKLREIAVSFISTSRSRPDFLCYVEKLSVLVMESWREHQEVAFYEEAKKEQEPSNIPNGTMGLPFLGESLSYLTPHNSNSMGSFLEKHCSRYGRVFKSHLFGCPTIVSCDLELNTFILQNEGRLFQSSYPKPVLDILRKLSIMLVSGDLHKKLRNIVVSIISTSRSRPDYLCYVEKLSKLKNRLFPVAAALLQEPSNIPNGTMGLPFPGETLFYLTPHNSNSMGSFLEKHCSRYGRVFKSHLFGCPTIVSCDLELNTFILQNEGRLFQSSYPKPVLDILGKLSVMLVSGDLHKKLRNIAVSFISTSRSRPDFLCYVEKLSVLVMESWREHQEVAFYEEAKKWQEPSNIPNGTMGLPFLGYTFSYLTPRNSNSMGSLLEKHCSRYGRRTLFQSSYPVPVLDNLGKRSIMFVSGDLHKKLRNIAVSFISTSRLRPDFLCYVEKLSVLVMESWREHQEVAFCEEAKKEQEPSNIPNGTMGLPFLGESLSYLTPHNSNSMGSFLEKHCSRYGRVFKYHLFGCPTIVSCDLEINTFILQNEGRLFQSSYPKPVLDILGKLSIMLVSDDLHKKLRNIVVSVISTSRSRPDFLCCVEKLSVLVMESWREHQEVSFYEEAKKAALLQEPSNIPNGTMGLPFVGETLSYLSPHNSNSMGSFLQKHCSRYGRVFKSHLFGCPTILSCDLELNTFIFQNEGRLFQSSYPKPVRDILRMLSIMPVSCDLHKKLRNIAISFIRTSRSRPDFLCYVEKLSVLVMVSWREHQEVSFYEEAKKLRTLQPILDCLPYFWHDLDTFTAIPADCPSGTSILAGALAAGI
ncbi:unnamed protein product [Camellia sinensis]